MEVLNTPELNLLHTGQALKTLQISALAGMAMPLHHSTKEAVLVMPEGSILLKMPNKEHQLTKETTFIIPARMPHSLEIKSNFRALAIMAVDSEIEF